MKIIIMNFQIMIIFHEQFSLNSYSNVVLVYQQRYPKILTSLIWRQHTKL